MNFAKLKAKIIEKHNQNIFDSVTPKSALLSNCLTECIEKCEEIVKNAIDKNFIGLDRILERQMEEDSDGIYEENPRIIDILVELNKKIHRELFGDEK